MNKQPDDKQRDEVLKRMLGTPPKPHVNESATKPTDKKEKKPGTRPASKD